MAYELSERKKAILKAIIDCHIQNGEPVGSKFLTQNKQFVLSSATIRNEMAELEEMGYLLQPHTSAGRIPSDAGYRFYVETLMQSYALTTQEIRELNNALKQKTQELDKILNDAARVMAHLTNYPSISVNTAYQEKTIMRFNANIIDERSFLLIMLFNRNTVKTRVIHTEFYLYPNVISTLEYVLNKYIAGKDVENLPLSQIIQMENELGEYRVLLSYVLKCVYDTIHDPNENKVHLDGVEKILAYPEFNDTEKLRTLLSFLSNKEELIGVVSRSKEGINIYIGSENPLDSTLGSSLVFKTIDIKGKKVATIGVLGPMRMDYSRVISTLEHLSSKIEEIISPPEIEGTKDGTTSSYIELNRGNKYKDYDE